MKKYTSTIVATLTMIAMIAMAVPAYAQTVAVSADNAATTAAVPAPVPAPVPVPVPVGIPTGNALGTAFALDALFAGNSNGLLSPYGTSIGDLFILDQLFGSPVWGGAGYGYGSGNALGTAFALNSLFKGNSNGLLSNTPGTSIGDVFVLDQLFH